MSTGMAESIQTNIEIMTRKLELEKRRLARLDKELTAASRTYELKAGQHHKNRKGETNSRPSTAPRAIAGGAGSAEERPKTGQSAVRASSAGERKFGQAGLLEPAPAPYRTLLHRLDVQIKKLDCVLNDNTRLQSDIDQVRRQRLQINSIFERLKLEIRQRAAQLMDVNEETATGKTVQGDAEQRVAVMKRQREGERARFKDQVLKIRRDLQDYDFEKKEVEVKLKRAQEGVQKKRGLIMPPEENDFSEPAMMRRIMKTAFLNCIQRRHIKQHEKTIALFEQAFATIKQTTGISNIEEIVKIFVVLESKNYSLLTYVNHMNREIEAFETVRMRRQTAESMRSQLEDKQEQYRDHTVGAIQKQLEAKQSMTLAAKDACAKHKELMYELLAPRLQQICRRIQVELDRLKKAAGHLSGEELPRLPAEVREEALPEWLDWIEKALGRFRDLIPTSDREQVFPMTARSQVTQLAPKRLNAPLVPLIKAQELPSAISMVSDDIPIQKRTNVTAAQKAEILDEEAEEEDFGDRPLSLKDIRQRAEQAAARRRKRTKPNLDAQSTLHSNTGDSAMRGLMSGTSAIGGERHSARPHEHAEEDHAALRSALDQREANGFNDDEDESHSHSGSEGQDGDGREGNSPKRGGHSRKEQLAAHLEEERGSQPDITEEELGAAFLKRYKMSREELQVMADRMGIHLSNLCFLKQEFDHYDEDQSGYIDAGELRGLLKKLGEELNDDELDAAFKDLDSDGSGEIEFFEFVEWFTTSE